MNISKFAKIAGVTEKTLRYYEKAELLMPYRNPENGYREFSERDLVHLQHILLFRKLGFSLQEIRRMTSRDQSLSDSLQRQHEMIRKKVSDLRVIDDSLRKLILRCEDSEEVWDEMLHLFQLIGAESCIAENYVGTRELALRISLHNEFSRARIPWFTWIAGFIDFQPGFKVLEIGCGNGELWKHINPVVLKECDIFLSDLSEGMISEVCQSMNHKVNALVCDCQSLPFKNDYFDIVIVNHMLFYLENPNHGLAEIKRVLKPGGTIYATTYGKRHMAEITELCQEFNEDVQLSSVQLEDRFGLDNGYEILAQYFDRVTCHIHDDCLEVTRSKPLIEYVLSCHGNQMELIKPEEDNFRVFLDQKIMKEGSIVIQKEACLFTAQKGKQ